MTRETKQAQTLLRVFESLGVPLMGAVAEVQLWSGTPAQPEESARQFAALLSASISLGTKMAEKLHPATSDDAANARLSAATMAAGLIAQHYTLSGQLPDDAFNRRCLEAFDGTLGLADSFGDKGDVDLSDPVAQRALALMPLVQAMMRFPFGLADNQIITRFGEDLVDRASALAQAFEGNNIDQEARELAFLKGCAGLLGRACDTEMSRLEQEFARGNTQQPNPEDLVNAIWMRFEDGLDVLRAVIGFASGQTGTDGIAPVIKTSTPRAKAPVADVEVPPIQQIEDGPFNPMAFFASKKEA